MRTINKLISRYNYNAGSISRVKYIVVHYVGALGGAKQNCQYYADADRNASAHYFVGFDGEIWQSVEDANIAWHCGASSYSHAECRNANSIGIEMCVRKENTASLRVTDRDWYFEDATVKAAAELTLHLMDKYNIPESNVIRHYDVTGKICPAPYVYNTTGHTWDEFKQLISGIAPQASSEERAIWEFLSGKGLNAYAVAGIMGNLYAESGLNAGNMQNSYNAKLGMTDAEYTAAVDNGSYSDFVHDGAGYGLAQWTYYSRKQALFDFAQKTGESIGNMNMQLDFLWREIQGYKSVMTELKAAASVMAASNAVLLGYEKPADQSAAAQKKRAEYCRAYYDKYAAEDAGITQKVPFTVKVDIDNLNIRTGAGTGYAKTGEHTGRGVFTITEVRAGAGSGNGWGKLKSGAGWIALDYCTRLV